jgi:YHS domain-containing protein
MKSFLSLAAVLLTTLALSVPAFAADEKKKEEGDAKKAKPINKLCPVEKGEVDPEVTVEHDGKVIGFCCSGCDTEFKKEPAKYMAVVEKELKDAAAKEKKDGKKQDKEPKLNTKCPVTGDGVEKTLTTDYEGRKVAFCCEDCLKDFEKDPKKYAAKLEKEDAGAKKDAKEDKKDEKKSAK